MSIEQNKATLRRYYDEVFKKGEFSRWHELMDEDYVMHSPQKGDLKGVLAAKQGYNERRTMSSDMQVNIDEMVAEGDTVVVRGSFKGTHTGEARGLVPTGKQFDRAFAAFYYFKNGKIKEGWTIHDVLTMYQQLGIMPPMPATAGVR